MKRRALLGGVGAAAFSALDARAEEPRWASSELDLSELSISGDAAFGRALLAVPRALPREPELLVLLHGLGETRDPEVGAHAFVERYGLLEAVARLTHPPLRRRNQHHDYFGPDRLEQLNLRLARRPFACPVIVCPYVPNPYKPGGDAVLERFTSFVCGPLRAEVERRLGTALAPSRCLLSGVSLGGYVAIEIFLSRPELFCGLCTAQAAFKRPQASRYAEAVAEATERVGPRRIEIVTSSFDPFRRANEAFYRALEAREQSAELHVSPGPHDQEWLKEAGVIEMLLGADEVLAAARMSRP